MAEEVKAEDLLKAFRTNLIAPVIAAQSALKHFQKQGSGHIINIGSPGFMMGIPFYSPYVCSKASLSAWTRTIQAEWEGRGIMISEYFPGYIATDSLPESRVGEVNQNFLMSEKQNFLTRTFAKPKSPERVARDIIRLALKPRLLMHSGFGVKIGSFISNLPSFRLSIARQMAKTARKKMKK
jgi:NAD(P)-dependent dehydrogenase (short-subunit alcohol dehydrogenase family)